MDGGHHRRGVAKAGNGEVPLAVLCDNSRDAESIPSDLSDFNRYGGLYRHVTLVYVPAISLERIHIEPSWRMDGKASVKVRARLYNPTSLKDETELAVEVRDRKRKTSPRLDAEMRAVGGVQEKSPRLKSPPRNCGRRNRPRSIAASSRSNPPRASSSVAERFGVRSVEWVEHGPFKLNGERLLLRGTHYHEDHAGSGGRRAG